MFKNLKWLLGILAVAILAATGFFIWQKMRFLPVTLDVAQISGIPIKKIGGTPSGIYASTEGYVYVTDSGYPLGKTIESRNTGFALWQADSALKIITPYSLDARPIQLIEDSGKIFINNGSEANGNFLVMDNATKKITQSLELKYTGLPSYSQSYFSNFFEYNNQLFLVSGDISQNVIPTFTYNIEKQKLEQTEIKAEGKSFSGCNFIGLKGNKAYFIAMDPTESRSSHLLTVNLDEKKIDTDINLGNRFYKPELAVFDAEKNIIYIPTISYAGDNNKEVFGSLFSIDVANGKMSELNLPSGVNEISMMILIKNKLVFAIQNILSGTVYIYDPVTQQVNKKINVGDSITDIKTSSDQTKLYVLTSVVKITDSYPKAATNPKLKLFETENFQKTGEISVSQSK